MFFIAICLDALIDFHLVIIISGLQSEYWVKGGVEREESSCVCVIHHEFCLLSLVFVFERVSVLASIVALSIYQLNTETV